MSCEVFSLTTQGQTVYFTLKNDRYFFKRKQKSYLRHSQPKRYRKSHTTEHFCIKILFNCTCLINFQERYIISSIQPKFKNTKSCFTCFARFVSMKLFSKSEQKQFHTHNLYKARKSTNNWSPNVDLIMETMVLSRIFLALPSLKFIYSVKVTKVWEISTVNLNVTT